MRESVGSAHDRKLSSVALFVSGNTAATSEFAMVARNGDWLFHVAPVGAKKR